MEEEKTEAPEQLQGETVAQEGSSVQSEEISAQAEVATPVEEPKEEVKPEQPQEIEPSLQEDGKKEPVHDAALQGEEEKDPESPEEAALHVEDKERKYPSQWFALHVLSGQEMNVKRYMESRVKTEEMGDYVHDLIIPTERVSEIRRGKKVETERKLYPGYIFVNMYLIGENKKLVDRTWYFVKETPGVIGFADGDYPIPMREKEVEAMLAQLKEREDCVVPKMTFELGDKVKVGDGPFQSQEGVIEEVDIERGRLRVAVSIFGRSTPVELEYWQVEKL